MQRPLAMPAAICYSSEWPAKLKNSLIDNIDLGQCRRRFVSSDPLLAISGRKNPSNQFIASLACARYNRCYAFELKSGEIVPIGKGRFPEIQKKFMDFLES